MPKKISDKLKVAIVKCRLMDIPADAIDRAPGWLIYIWVSDWETYDPSLRASQLRYARLFHPRKYRKFD